jgi:hypothetical protein
MKGRKGERQEGEKGRRKKSRRYKANLSIVCYTGFYIMKLHANLFYSLHLLTSIIELNCTALGSTFRIFPSRDRHARTYDKFDTHSNWVSSIILSYISLWFRSGLWEPIFEQVMMFIINQATQSWYGHTIRLHVLHASAYWGHHQIHRAFTMTFPSVCHTPYTGQCSHIGSALRYIFMWYPCIVKCIK